jgi:hypothetical protein
MVTGVISPQRTQAAIRAQTTASAKTSDFADELKRAVASQTKKTTNLDDIFCRASQQYHVPVNLLKAVAKAESGFDADAVSSCGAEGIMQLMPSTARALGVTDSFDPEQNIMGGAKYLGQLLTSFGGDVTLAVAGYNAGGGAVRKYGGVPPYRETQNYIKKVLGYAGMDLSVPETAISSGISFASSSAISAVDDAAVPMVELPFGAEAMQSLAQMYVQRLEQRVLEDMTEAADQKNPAV